MMAVDATRLASGAIACVSPSGLSGSRSPSAPPRPRRARLCRLTQRAAVQQRHDVSQLPPAQHHRPPSSGLYLGGTSVASLLRSPQHEQLDALLLVWARCYSRHAPLGGARRCVSPSSAQAGALPCRYEEFSELAPPQKLALYGAASCWARRPQADAYRRQGHRHSAHPNLGGTALTFGFDLLRGQALAQGRQHHVRPDEHASMPQAVAFGAVGPDSAARRRMSSAAATGS